MSLLVLSFNDQAVKSLISSTSSWSSVECSCQCLQEFGFEAVWVWSTPASLFLLFHWFSLLIARSFVWGLKSVGWWWLMSRRLLPQVFKQHFFSLGLAQIYLDYQITRYNFPAILKSRQWVKALLTGTPFPTSSSYWCDGRNDRSLFAAKIQIGGVSYCLMVILNWI